MDGWMAHDNRSNLQGLFYIYWFDDLIAPNFSLLGHHLTNSSQSALAITQVHARHPIFLFPRCLYASIIVPPPPPVCFARVTMALCDWQSVTAAGSFVFALPGGWLGDRLGPLPVLITTGFLTCIFPVLNAFVPNCELPNVSSF
eukprot:SAG22_NODE_35_length_27276_cov_20.395849_5_plen_144_part_00